MKCVGLKIILNIKNVGSNLYLLFFCHVTFFIAFFMGNLKKCKILRIRRYANFFQESGVAPNLKLYL